jgi:Tfp pilus assembly protein PilF
MSDGAATSSAAVPSRGGWWTAVILAGACLAVYWNSLGAPFLFDDGPAILRNETIRQLWPLDRVLQPPLEGAGVTGRPLVNLSLAVNYALGGLEVRGYHAMNLALHVLAVLTLWGVLRRTLRFEIVGSPLVGGPPRDQGTVRRQAPTLPNAAESFAFTVALLWAVHPLLTESVVCVVQRNEVMGGLFYLLVLYAFIRAVSGGGRLWLAASVAACLLGMATKEIMATAPLLVLLYDRTFVAGGFAAAWRQRRGYYLSLAATWLLLAWLMLGNNQRDGIVGFGLGVSSWEYLLTQCRALTTYLQLSLWPHPLVLDYGAEMVRRPAEVWLQGILVVTLLLATGWALVRKPVWGFLGAWFFIILAPSSSFVPLTTQPIAEHRMYLPLVAVLVLALAGIRRLAGPRTVLVVGLLAVALGAATFRRNEVYRDEERLWTDLIARQPANARAHASLGHYLVRTERWAEAAVRYEQVLRLRPDYADARSDYAGVLSRLGRLPEAIPHYEEALRLKPDDATIHYNLGLALMQAGRLPEARVSLENAVRQPKGRGRADWHAALGNVLLDLNEVPAAAGEFARALEIQPAATEARHNLALALVRLGRPAEAIPHYEAVLRQLPGSAQVHHNLAFALAQAGRVAEAIGQEEEALRLNPGLTAAREQLVRLRGR